MTTTVPPMALTLMQKRSGAAWYSGAGDRYTVSPVAPNSICNRASTGLAAASSGSGRNSRATPLGSPVVPDE